MSSRLRERPARRRGAGPALDNQSWSRLQPGVGRSLRQGGAPGGRRGASRAAAVRSPYILPSRLPRTDTPLNVYKPSGMNAPATPGSWGAEGVHPGSGEVHVRAERIWRRCTDESRLPVTNGESLASKRGFSNEVHPHSTCGRCFLLPILHPSPSGVSEALSRRLRIWAGGSGLGGARRRGGGTRGAGGRPSRRQGHSADSSRSPRVPGSVDRAVREASRSRASALGGKKSGAAPGARGESRYPAGQAL